MDGYLDTVENLPPTPALLVQLIELFQQPDRDVDEVVKLMSQDPALTADVLRKCSSSFFGDNEPVTNVNEAVFRLGFYEVYRMTVALFGLQAMTTAKFAKSIEVEALWRHSALTAMAAGVLAREAQEPEGAVFTAGLLHDVGKIVFASAEGPRYAALLAQHGHGGTSLYEAEKLAFGFSHGEIGARLLARWGVPAEVSIPVLGHHNLEWSMPYARLAAIVSLANLIAHCLEDTLPGTKCVIPEAAPALKLLELGEDELPGLVEQTRRDAKRLHSLLVAKPAK